jgi:hypothetical protein
MKNSRTIFLVALMFLCAASLFARGSKEKDTAPASRLVQVTGVVRLVGSSPFYDLVVTGSDSQWYISGDEQYKLYDLQQRTVTIEGDETVIEMTFANGMSAGQRRLLKNIRIISVD